MSHLLINHHSLDNINSKINFVRKRDIQKKNITTSFTYSLGICGRPKTSIQIKIIKLISIALAANPKNIPKKLYINFLISKKLLIFFSTYSELLIKFYLFLKVDLKGQITLEMVIICASKS